MVGFSQLNHVAEMEVMIPFFIVAFCFININRVSLLGIGDVKVFHLDCRRYVFQKRSSATTFEDIS